VAFAAKLAGAHRRHRPPDPMPAWTQRRLSLTARRCLAECGAASGARAQKRRRERERERESAPTNAAVLAASANAAAVGETMWREGAGCGCRCGSPRRDVADLRDMRSRSAGAAPAAQMRRSTPPTAIVASQARRRGPSRFMCHDSMGKAALPRPLFKSHFAVSKTSSCSCCGDHKGAVTRACAVQQRAKSGRAALSCRCRLAGQQSTCTACRRRALALPSSAPNEKGARERRRQRAAALPCGAVLRLRRRRHCASNTAAARQRYAHGRATPAAAAQARSRGVLHMLTPCSSRAAPCQQSVRCGCGDNASWTAPGG
jgi:hypothetical protein